MRTPLLALTCACIVGCAADPVERVDGGGGSTAENCLDGIDNDSDGFVDCSDQDCAQAGACAGGTTDTGVQDTGTTDTGTTDTGVQDTGTTDTGTTDTGVQDTGSADTGVQDTGVQDTGPADTGPADTGTTDTGTTDTGTTDTGTADTTPPPVDLQFSGPFSYIWRIQVPEPGTPAECCFDFTGDGLIDNGFGTLVGATAAISPGTDVQASLDSPIADGSTALMFEYAGLNESTLGGPTQLWLYAATNDLNGDGVADQQWVPTRVAGRGLFQVEPYSLADDGSPLVRFESAYIDGNLLTAGPGAFPIEMPFVFSTVSVVIQQAYIQADIRSEASGFFTNDADIDSDGNGVPEVWGGAQLGGIVPADQAFSDLSYQASNCACAGLSFFDQLFIAGEGFDTYEVACDSSITINDSACSAADGELCQNLSTICGFAPAFPTIGLIDVDTNGNGIPDAISVGLRLSMSGAALATPPVAW